MAEVAVIGAGSWGTALAGALAGMGHGVRLWAREEEVVASIREEGRNRLFLPDIVLPAAVGATSNLEEALAPAEIVLSVMPSHVCRALYERMAPLLRSDMVLVSATKGLEEGTLMRMSEVIRAVLSPRFEPRVAVLSGPSFAREVARGEPTAIVAASASPDLAGRIQREFSSRTLRLYASDDVVGVELGGAVKNVIAIAAGVVEGLGLGHNPMAALVTRGLAEVSRLAEACGGRQDTLAGLAGMGDLVLTCTGAQSRNRRVGVELGKGRRLDDILRSMHEVAEGVKTTEAVLELSRRLGVDMPIATMVGLLLRGAISPREAIDALMERSLKSE
ncbi:MAG: NAD(P)-dependent glycerol-3-phosphate dehydrogenase [Acidobacteria bacterium]|nr:NAD(P)-dependent glycerol-3-phosphate dehydrogenase [Acidobacteriota bacterium]